MPAKPKKQKCYIKVCKSTDLVARGLCSKCYPTARYLVRTGKATWDQLESMGLAKPKRAVNASPLFDAFMAIKRKSKTNNTIFTKRIK